MVPEVIIDIDGTNYTENSLIHKSQYLGDTLVPPLLLRLDYMVGIIAIFAIDF